MAGFLREIFGGKTGDNNSESFLRFLGIRTREMKRKERVADRWEERCRNYRGPNPPYPPDKFGG